MNKLKEAFTRFDQFELNHSVETQWGKRRRIQIQRALDWELILMVWGPDSQTEIHDHNNSQCWTRILSGELVEHTFQGDIPRLIDSQILKQGGAGYIDDKLGTHQLINKNKENVISLHLYAAPIKESHVFDQASGLWICTHVTSEHMQEKNYDEKSISP